MHTPTLPLVASLLLASATALADIPPPPDYVENCTLQKQQRGGERCASCSGTRTASDAGTCGPYATQGYTHRCNTYGASNWTEVWCRPCAENEYCPPPPTPEGGGCSVARRAPHAGAGAILALVAVAGLAFRRRSASRR